jgi:hypothetical protein
MADSKLSALSAAGAFSDADELYIVQGGASYKTTWGAIKAAILLAKYPEVANYAALPAAASHSGETYVCLAAQGTYFISRKPAGFYYSNGTAWSFVGELPENYFTDSILQIADDADPTKIAKFQLSGITTGTTRTLTLADASGTIVLDTTLAALIHALTGKTTPVDADELPLIDSAASNALKKLTWANLKATLKTYFDGLYDAAGAAAAITLTSLAGGSSPTGSGGVVRAGSPGLTGSPTAPTQTAGDNSTKLATTAYVDTAVAAIGSSGGVTTGKAYALAQGFALP